MHIADLDGRIYERRKRETRRELQFAAWCFLIFFAILALILWA